MQAICKRRLPVFLFTYNSMKKITLFTIAAIVSVSMSSLLADDTYTAQLSGVECDGCKKTIARSLAKIDGVKTIRIVKNADGTHAMTVTTDDGTQITEKQAAEAIKHAEHYKIQSWKKAD